MEKSGLFNQLDERQMGQHVQILGWLHILGGAMFLAIGALVFFLLTGISVATGDAEALAVLSVVATGIAGFLALLALPGIVAGMGLLYRKNWARILAVVVAILNIVNFPIGTVMGLYTMWVLFQATAIDYFENETLHLRPHQGQPVA